MKIILSGFAAIGILSIINLVYSYSGIHVDNDTGATDYIWESRQLKSNMTEGFSWLTLDETGYNNTDENFQKAMKDGIDILIMGSSHMEAVEVSEDKNLGYLLNKDISGKNTYNIGISGHDIYRIIDNIQDAVKTYHPEEFIILETDLVELEETKMKAVLTETAKKIPSYDSGIIYYMQKIPAFKWLYQSLSDWISQSDMALWNTEVVENQKTVNLNEYEDILVRFLGICAKVCDENKCTPVIFYHPKAEILNDGNVVFFTDPVYLEIFNKACNENDIVFVDMTDDFYKRYEKDFVLPHGFINSYTGNGHLNEYGHQMLAERLSHIVD